MMKKYTKPILVATLVACILIAIFMIRAYKQSQYFDEYSTTRESFVALKKNPNDVKARRGVATYYTSQRRYEDAILQLRVINKIDPDDRVDLLQLGNVLAVAGHKEEAFQIFNKLAGGNDDNADYARKAIAKYSRPNTKR